MHLQPYMSFYPVRQILHQTWSEDKERQIARNTSTILPSWHLFGFMSIITKIRKGMLGHLSFMINGEEGGGGHAVC